MLARFFHIYTPGEPQTWCGVNLLTRPRERVDVCQIRTAEKEQPAFFYWENGTNMCVDCAFAHRARRLPKLDPKVWRLV